MSILSGLNEEFEIASSFNASSENEIKNLLKFSSIGVPKEYVDVISEKTEIEIHLKDRKYIRIWGASGCIEMNSAYSIQEYLPDSLAIGDDEDSNALIYATGKKGFGLYVVSFGNLDLDDMIYIADSLENLLKLGQGVDELVKL